MLLISAALLICSGQPRRCLSLGEPQPRPAQERGGPGGLLVSFFGPVLPQAAKRTSGKPHPVAAFQQYSALCARVSLPLLPHLIRTHTLRSSCSPIPISHTNSISNSTPGGRGGGGTQTPALLPPPHDPIPRLPYCNIQGQGRASAPGSGQAPRKARSRGLGWRRREPRAGCRGLITTPQVILTAGSGGAAILRTTGRRRVGESGRPWRVVAPGRDSQPPAGSAGTRGDRLTSGPRGARSCTQPAEGWGGVCDSNVRVVQVPQGCVRIPAGSPRPRPASGCGELRARSSCGAAAGAAGSQLQPRRAQPARQQPSTASGKGGRGERGGDRRGPAGAARPGEGAFEPSRAEQGAPLFGAGPVSSCRGCHGWREAGEWPRGPPAGMRLVPRLP